LRQTGQRGRAPPLPQRRRCPRRRGKLGCGLVRCYRQVRARQITPMLSTFVNIVHVFVCLVLMFVVLLQQGKGGGMGSAFGGASAQVFGGSGAGNLLTRATAICAGLFMLSSVWLA